MPRLRKPCAIAPGATIGIAAPAFPIDAPSLAAGTEALEAAGFRVRHRRDLTQERGYLAGTDAARAKEVMALVRDPKVDAIVCVRGGYGCQRMVPGLDAAAVRKAGKPLVGFSDITTLLLWQLRRVGLVGFHGLMFNHSPTSDEMTSMVEALTGATPDPWIGEGQRRGVGRGRLVGGSLTLIAASLGTPWEVDLRDRILMIEEVGEKPYAIDRLLSQLGAAGKLERLAGVAVGHLQGCTDRKRPTPDAESVLMELLAPLKVPVVFGLPFGHGSPNLTWPMGARAELDGRRGSLSFLESGVVQP